MLYEEDYTVNEVRDQKRRATERKNREAAKGAMDLPFLLLTGLVMGMITGTISSFTFRALRMANMMK